MVKLGFASFWGDGVHNINLFEIDNYFLKAFRKYGIEYSIVNPFDVECDVLFFSCFMDDVLDYIVGNPCRILYDGEDFIKRYENRYDYSLSFMEDSENNLYFPLWQINYDRLRDNPIDKSKLTNKTLFCTRLVRACYEYRENIYQYITNNYRRILSCGSLDNNVGGCLPSYFEGFKILQHFHEPIKFNMCFENHKTEGNDMYITEKIIHAYTFGTVPIYCGSEGITKYFNEDSFINCNGLTNEEIVEKIREIDCDDEKYYNMLNACPFKQNIDWKEYSYDRLIDFLRRKNII